VFTCPPKQLLEDQSLIIEAHFIARNLNSSLFSNETHAAVARSILSVRWQGGEGGLKSCTTEMSPYHPTLVHQILQSWDLILGIAVGLILIILTLLACQKLDVFNRVRIYRGHLEAMAITRTEATPSAFDYDNMDVDEDVVIDHGDFDEGEYVDKAKQTKNGVELQPEGAVFYKHLENIEDNGYLAKEE
jgi:hypothetical protein